MVENRRKKRFWQKIVALLVILISIVHYATPVAEYQIHLLYMESFFIPILIAAFQLGIRGGIVTSLAVSLIYFPHIIFQWGGGFDNNLFRFMQILLFNVIGYLTGLKAQGEFEEKKRYGITANRLERSFRKLEAQSTQLAELDEQIRLMDRLALVGELTASLAHEVRNPLASIRGAVEILTEELPDDSRNSQFFRILLEETERLNSVVENYLNFTRKPVARNSRYDPISVARSACSIISKRVYQASIKFEYRLPDVTCYINGDPNDLQQVLVNLVVNAIQAMTDGGVITLSARITPLEKSEDHPDPAESRPSGLELKVSDTGTGMSPDALERIFDPFFTTRAEGTGLGLSIVRRICEQNQWSIQVESTPGEGTDFTLHLPFLESVQPEFKKEVKN